MASPSGVALLEHLNINISPPCMVATLAALTSLGFAVDPRPGARGKSHTLAWMNAGLQQLHLPVDAAPGAPPTQEVDGEIGFLVPRGTLPSFASRAAAAGCRAEAPAGGGALRVLDALGANVLTFEEEPAMGAPRRFVGGPSEGCAPPPCEAGAPAPAPLGLHRLRLRVPPGALPGIAAFWREVFRARVEAAEGHVIVWCDGAGAASAGSQRIEFVGAPPPLKNYDGWHAAVYVRDFKGAFERAERWGALFDNARFSDRCGTYALAAEHQQFRTLHLGASGVRMELEVRSLAHAACPLPAGAGNAPPPPPSPAPRVLSIQSHVVVGCVGNKAATLPLQLLGWDVCALNTCHLSNHTGYTTFAGGRLSCEELAAVVGALRANGMLATLSAVLTGYMASPALLGALGELVGEVRAAAAASGRTVRYVCDPVLGDETASAAGAPLVGKLYVPPEIVPLMRAHVRAARPELLTPNAFEAATLAELPPLRSVSDALRACDALHALGARAVVITSSWVERAPGALLLVGSAPWEDVAGELGGGGGAGAGTGRAPLWPAGRGPAPFARFGINIPRLGASFTGTGDLIAALLLAHGDGGGAPPSLAAACELATAAVFGTCELTVSMAAREAGGAAGGAPAPELRLVEASALLQRPVVREGMRAFALVEE
jgi:pyridoxine kinase